MSTPPFAPPLPEGRYLDLPGRGRTFVRKAEGPPGAPTLLLLHGWTASADLNWFRCYEPLRQHFSVIAIDHRGHGRGIRTRRPFTLADCADDAAALVKVLDGPPVVAVGYSMGGPVAQLLWRRHRSLVRGLVLCATSYDFGRRPTDRVLLGSMLGLAAIVRLTPDRWLRDVSTRVLSRRLEATPVNTWIAAELARNDPATLLEAGSAIGRFSAARWIGEVDVPTAVVVTLDDQVVSLRRQLRLAHAIPGAKTIPISGDHGVCVAEGGRFAAAVIQAVTHVVESGQPPAQPGGYQPS